MDFEWDEAKDRANRGKHGIGFDRVTQFEWPSAIIIDDARYDYGECRQRAFGFIDEKLHVVVFTIRKEQRRIISLRRANNREERFYETLQT